jgi:hypothetical protein
VEVGDLESRHYRVVNTGLRVPRHFIARKTDLIGEDVLFGRTGEENNFFQLLGTEKRILGRSSHSIVPILTELTPASVWSLYVV